MCDANNSLPNRRSIRYKGYDYTSPGAYFITICAYKGRPLFGIICDQESVLNPLGHIAEQCWQAVPQHHVHVILDEHVIMPNHVHVLFWLKGDASGAEEDTIYRVRTTARATEPVDRHFGGSIGGSVSTIIGSYKAAVTREAGRAGLIPGPPLWHGRFWDRIVRTEPELARIRQYIRSNPARWLEDQLHPSAPPNHFNQWRE